MTKARHPNVVYVDRVFSNVAQEIVEITTDKLTLILNQHVSRLETNASWQTPLGVVLTLVLTLATTTTRKSLGLSADVWEAIFIIATVLCIGWLIRCLWRARKCPTIEQIIAEMKKGASNTP